MSETWTVYMAVFLVTNIHKYIIHNYIHMIHSNICIAFMEYVIQKHFIKRYTHYSIVVLKRGYT